MTIGVRAIIKDKDSIIMVSHNEKDHGHLLLFPGGGIEKGESIFQAAEREVLEETHLLVEAKSIAYMREVAYKGEFGIEIYVLCDLRDGELKLGHDPEHDENNQVLTGVERIPIVELNNHDWKPEELRDLLQADLEAGINIGSMKYLGLRTLG